MGTGANLLCQGDEGYDMALWEYVEELEPTVLITAGFVLFVIPEPATSAIGVGMMLLGIAWWVQEWRAPEDVERGDGQREPISPEP